MSEWCLTGVCDSVTSVMKYFEVFDLVSQWQHDYCFVGLTLYTIQRIYAVLSALICSDRWIVLHLNIYKCQRKIKASGIFLNIEQKYAFKYNIM